MKRVRNYIKAASEDDSKLALLTSQLEDDFDYLLAGFDKLDRTGATESNEGLVIAEGVADAIQDAIAQVSEVIGGLE